jgi:hypothetical protein
MAKKPPKFKVEVQETGRAFNTFTRFWTARVVAGPKLSEDLKLRRGYTKGEALSNLMWSIKGVLGVEPEFETVLLPRKRVGETPRTSVEKRA